MSVPPKLARLLNAARDLRDSEDPDAITGAVDSLILDEWDRVSSGRVGTGDRALVFDDADDEDRPVC